MITLHTVIGNGIEVMSRGNFPMEIADDFWVSTAVLCTLVDVREFLLGEAEIEDEVLR